MLLTGNINWSGNIAMHSRVTHIGRDLTGCPWRDVRAAVAIVFAAIRFRRGAGRFLVEVTATTSEDKYRHRRNSHGMNQACANPASTATWRHRRDRARRGPAGHTHRSGFRWGTSFNGHGYPDVAAPHACSAVNPASGAATPTGAAPS